MQDDDFAEFIGDSGDFELEESNGQQPRSVRYLQADEIAMAKLENAKRKNEITEMPGPSEKAQAMFTTTLSLAKVIMVLCHIHYSIRYSLLYTFVNKFQANWMKN